MVMIVSFQETLVAVLALANGVERQVVV